MTVTVGSLCSGYGGMEMALTLAGYEHELTFVADIDPGASKILAARYPGVPNLGDISEVAWSELQRVNILTAGFPCQDVSMAGRRRGLREGTRTGVWAHVAEAIEIMKPSLVFLENVRGLFSAAADSDLEFCSWCVGDGANESVLRALGAVLGNLADIGYDAIWTTVSAASVGAPHQRERVFVVAWPIADPPRFGQRDGRLTGIEGVPAAAVAGDAETNGLTLLPTPRAQNGENRNQRIWARNLSQPQNLENALALLPTPQTMDGYWGGVSPESLNARIESGKQIMLSHQVFLLPTPTASDVNGPGEHGTDGPDLRTAVSLLPTPMAGNADQGSHSRIFGKPMLSGTILSAVDAQRWGDYAPAVARWERVIGRPAPPAIQLSKNETPQLSPLFVEWMQGLPQSFVTDVANTSRSEQLRILGNGIVPQQGAAAITELLSIAAHVLDPTETPAYVRVPGYVRPTKPKLFEQLSGQSDLTSLLASTNGGDDE